MVVQPIKTEELLEGYKLDFLEYSFLNSMGKIPPDGFTRQRNFLDIKERQDEALQWYQWFEKARRDVSWEEFTHALCVRFEPSNYEDFDEALAKL